MDLAARRLECDDAVDLRLQRCRHEIPDRRCQKICSELNPFALNTTALNTLGYHSSIVAVRESASRRCRAIQDDDACIQTRVDNIGEGTVVMIPLVHEIQPEATVEPLLTLAATNPQAM